MMVVISYTSGHHSLALLASRLSPHTFVQFHDYMDMNWAAYRMGREVYPLAIEDGYISVRVSGGRSVFDENYDLVLDESRPTDDLADDLAQVVI